MPPLNRNVDNSQNLYSKLNNSDNADKEAINRRRTKRYKEAIEGPTVYRN